MYVRYAVPRFSLTRIASKRTFDFPPEPEMLSKRPRTMTMTNPYDRVQSSARARRQTLWKSFSGTTEPPTYDSPSTERVAAPPPSRNPSASPQLPDTPPWMRPMLLMDTDSMSIYKTAHGESPRYSLCLHCFSRHGDFCKVLTRGYETCGRHQVLRSHYWESNAWPEESDEED
jgi:hypothetical protein